ncbi:MAG TPA: hypothetical protein VI299_12930 [Polyangiales bacterium]
MSKRAQIAARIALFALLVTTVGCALLRPLPSPILIDAPDRPALFLDSSADAAQIGYLGDDVPLEITGRAREGRVPVRIDGALRTRGFVDVERLTLRVQRRGRIRGTPIYVGPNDVVGIRGKVGRRSSVRAQARLHGRALGPSYEGTYPREGLAVTSAPLDAQPPDVGEPYVVPAATAVPLHEAPDTAQAYELPPQHESYEVRVLNRAQHWLAVRAGEGPYLIGWTPLALERAHAEVPSAHARHGSDTPGSASGTSLPVRLVNEPGALKRVAAGSKVVFGDQVIGVLKRDGYARVVQEYQQAGYADVFVAADDQVALRGLVRASDLREPSAK